MSVKHYTGPARPAPPPPPVQEGKGEYKGELRESPVDTKVAEVVKPAFQAVVATRSREASIDSISSEELDTSFIFDDEVDYSNPNKDHFPEDVVAMLKSPSQTKEEQDIKDHLVMQGDMQWDSHGYSSAGRNKDRAGYNAKVMHHKDMSRGYVSRDLTELGFHRNKIGMKVFSSGPIAKNARKLLRQINKGGEKAPLFPSKVERALAFDASAAEKVLVERAFTYSKTSNGVVHITPKEGKKAKDARWTLRAASITSKKVLEILQSMHN